MLENSVENTDIGERSFFSEKPDKKSQSSMGLAALTAALSSVTLSPEEAAMLMKMIDKKRKIATVEKLHTNRICEERRTPIYEHRRW